MSEQGHTLAQGMVEPMDYGIDCPGYFPGNNLDLISWTNYYIIFIGDVKFAMFSFQMKKLWRF